MPKQLDIASLTPQAVEEALASGQTVFLHRDGRVVAEVTPTAPVVPPTPDLPKVGFMKGEFSIPEDFDRLYAEEIANLFENAPLMTSTSNQSDTR